MASAREQLLRSRLYKIVLWVILFSMGGGTLLFTPNLFKKWGGPTQPTVVMVNGNAITVKEFQSQVLHEYERIALLQQQLGDQADTILKAWGLDNPEEMAVNELVQQALLNQIADLLHIRIAPSYIMQKLQDPNYVVTHLRSIVPISALEQTGALNFSMLRYHLAKQGLSLGDFEHAVEQAIRRNQVLALLESTAYVTSSDITRYFIEHFVPKKYTIVTFPLEKYIKEVKTESVSNEQLNAFFSSENKKSKRYWVPEQRSAKAWYVNPEKYGISVTDEDINAYYQQHKQQYLEKPASIQIRRILFKKAADVTNDAAMAELEKKARMVEKEAKEHPEKFEELARKYSDEKQSATKGGLLDFFCRGTLDPAIERMAFRLSEDKAVSDLFVSNDGIELIQRVARKPATYKPLATVQSDIEKQLIKQKFSHQFGNEIQQLINQADTNPNALQEFFAKKEAKNITIEQQKLDDSLLLKKVFKTPASQTSFFIDTDGRGVIIRTTGITKKHEPSFESVKEQVKEDYYKQAAQKQLAEALQKAQKMASKDSLSAVADKFGLKSETTDWIKKEDKEQWEKLEKKKLPTSELFNLSSAHPIGTSVSTSVGHLFKIATSGEYTENDIKAKQQEIKQAIYREQEEFIKRGYIASLYRNATIKSMKNELSSQSEVPMDEPL